MATEYSIFFYFRLAADINDWLEVLMNGNVRLVIDSSNNLCYMQGESLTPIEALNAHQWYYIRCTVDPSTNTYDVYIDETLEHNNAPFYDISGGMNNLRFAGVIDGQTTVGKAYWDNILVKYTTLPKLAITDPSDLDTDDDGINDDVEIDTYSTDPNDYDSDDDSFLPHYDFNDGTEIQYWQDEGFSSTEAGLRAKNMDVDEDQLSDGFEVFLEFDPSIYQISNAQLQLDNLDNMHVVWQEENSPYEIYYKNNVACASGWNAEVQLTDTPDPAFSVQPRLSIGSIKVYVEWIEVKEVTPEHWNGKWWIADSSICDDYWDNHEWQYTEIFNYESDKQYAFVYPPPGHGDPENIFPEPTSYFVGVNPGDFNDYWTITPINPDDWTTPWQPEPIEAPNPNNLAPNTPTIDQIKEYIEDFDPGKYLEDEIPAYEYHGPTPDGMVIFTILKLIQEREGIDFDPTVLEPASNLPPIPLPDLPFGDDSDGDGLTDNQEDTLYQTDKNDPDSDDDHYFDFYYDGEYRTFYDGDEVYYWDNEIGAIGVVEGWERDLDDDGISNLVDPDSDGDGLPDGWEAYFGFKPYDNGFDDLSTLIPNDGNIINGPDGDPENDGLTNLQEYNLRTDPTVRDTDGDGLYDGWLDSNHDGTYDIGQEAPGEVGDINNGGIGGFNTNPTKKDTDGDGLWDGWHDDDHDNHRSSWEDKGEVGDPVTGLGGYDTCPTETGFDDDDDGLIDEDPVDGINNDGDGKIDEDPDGYDTDGDCVKDGYEIYYIKDIDWDGDGYNSQIDPDSDNDDIIDGNEEFSWDSDDDGWCNANDVDSDGEGLFDYEEDLDKDGRLDHGETHPSFPDTEFDGLNDYKEKCVYFTDPRIEDSDNDGLKDGPELSEWNKISSNAWKTNYDGDQIANNLWDSDSDNDDLNDGDEVTYGTKMNNQHSDGDILIDGLEVHTIGTDPTKDDTDVDGINDDLELTFWDSHGSTFNANIDDDKNEYGNDLINILDWDSDGDLISDGSDNSPADYNDVDGTTFNYDAITVNNNIGVSVAIVYSGGSIIKPEITPCIPETTLNAGIPKYFDISTASPQSYNAIIKVLYSLPLPIDVDESHIRMYKWHDSINKWKIETHTNVDINKDYFWSKVTEFSTRQGGDAEDEDSDDDEFYDWQEIEGYTTSGYYYNGDYYGRDFIFKTDPNNPDTDDDGLNDNLDPIPLDYDMDGDGLLNVPYLTMGYNIDDIYTGGGIDINSNDDDMDGDGYNDASDDDDDNDGMNDMYETNYGDIPDTFNDGLGWQNPFIHNERYAILVGGGSTDDKGDKKGGDNWDAFWNDPKNMYNALIDTYNYENNNIYLHHWNKKHGAYGVYVVGPGSWTVDPIDQPTWGLGVKDSLSEISQKITKNDFFLFLVSAHASGSGFTLTDYETGNDHGIRYGINPDYPEYPNLEAEFNNLRFKKATMVFGSCWSENAFLELYGENRILIASAECDEGSYTWENYFEGSSTWDNHYEFYNNERDGDNEGFIYSIKHDGIISIKHAFVDGYNAARHDDIGGGDDTSHAKLDDNGLNNGMNNNGADGYGKRKSGLWTPGDPISKDGYWAYHTYL